MLEQMMPGLAIAVLGAPAWIAYYHPRQFADFASPLLGALMIAFYVALGVWCAALLVVTKAVYALRSPDFDFERIMQAVNAIEAYYPGYLYGIIIPTAVGLYLQLLQWLPRLGMTNDARQRGNSPRS